MGQTARAARSTLPEGGHQIPRMPTGQDLCFKVKRWQLLPRPSKNACQITVEYAVAVPAGGVPAGLRGVFCQREADREDLGAPAGGLA